MEVTEATVAMKPWEQHHAIISMPRFAYNPMSVLQQTAGFLVTCTFRREKSATKEILALIQEYMNLAEDGSEKHRGSNGTETGEVGKQSAEEVEQALSKTGDVPRFQEVAAISCPAEESGMPLENSKIVGNSTLEEAGRIACLGKEDSTGRLNEGDDQAVRGLGSATPSHEDVLKTGGSEFTLVKLATMGVIYICAACKPPSTVLSIASRIVNDVQAGTRAAPQWCHRIVPVQATCSTKREELHAVVSRLVTDHLRDHVRPCEQPINYAVAFNRRGADGAKSCSTDSSETTALGRDECIKIVASAVQQVTSTLKVDLTSPQMVVSVELIPVAGAQSCLMCAVSILPGDLVVSKPKINVKPLAPLNPKSKKRKNSR